jgi:hypothetical protein
MMALFIELWLLNSSKQVQDAVGGYFKDPTGTSKKVGSDMVGQADNFVLSKRQQAGAEGTPGPGAAATGNCPRIAPTPLGG